MLKTILTCAYCVCLIVSNLIQKTITLPFNITCTAGVIVFPIVYILSDVFSEVYGYKYSRQTCFLAFALNFFAVLVFQVAISLPPYDAAYEVLRSAPRILLASAIGFLAGDAVNDRVFTLGKTFYSRALLSSIAGECVDSLCFFPLAFAGVLPLNLIFSMAFVQTGLKLMYEAVLLPLTAYITKSVKSYENTSAI